MAFKIGDFQFINMSRTLSGPMARLARETRPGVNGCTLWHTGVRSEPIQLMTMVDTADVVAAASLLRSYEAAAGGDPLAVEFAGDFLDGLKVVIADVQPVDGGVTQTLLGIGGTLNGSQGLLRCVWVLQPIHPFKELRA